jgi:RimJ/RimL family protein N-acetyltransferase
LFLRPGWAEDAPALASLLNDAQISCKLGRVPYPYGLDDAHAFLAAERPAQDLTCLIFRRGVVPELIGGIGLIAMYGGTELGYWLARGHWGQGYATEAGQAMLHAARHALGRRQVTAQHSLDNPASGRVLRKLGFRATGHVRNVHSAARGAEMPCAGYVIDLTCAPAAAPHQAMAA